MNEDYIELKLVMRSKTTFGTDDTLIRVFSDQRASDVAKRAADGYGAEVVGLFRTDGTDYVEDAQVEQSIPAERG